jgi:hypothetical protein
MNDPATVERPGPWPNLYERLDVRYGTPTRPTADTKRCYGCLLVKPLTGFHRASDRSDGRDNLCGPCSNEKRRKRRRSPDLRRFADLPESRRFYAGLTRKLKGRLTFEQYQDMLSAQGGVCALCGGVNPRVRLVVDHCHETGRIRGLLCTGCNVALGRLGDTPESLQRVLAYLTSGAASAEER